MPQGGSESSWQLSTAGWGSLTPGGRGQPHFFSLDLCFSRPPEYRVPCLQCVELFWGLHTRAWPSDKQKNGGRPQRSRRSGQVMYSQGAYQCAVASGKIRCQRGREGQWETVPASNTEAHLLQGHASMHRGDKIRVRQSKTFASDAGNRTFDGLIRAVGRHVLRCCLPAGMRAASSSATPPASFVATRMCAAAGPLAPGHGQPTSQPRPRLEAAGGRRAGVRARARQDPAAGAAPACFAAPAAAPGGLSKYHDAPPPSPPPQQQGWPLPGAPPLAAASAAALTDP